VRTEQEHQEVLGLEPVKLGKKAALQYIPFSELVIPWDICVDETAEHDDRGGWTSNTPGALALASETGMPDTLASLKALKQEDLEGLKRSIGQFGLLKPFEVAALPEELGFFFGKGKYAIMDGQRRYFAMRELLRLPTEQDERRRHGSLRTHTGNPHLAKAEAQAQEHLGKLSVRDYVLVPCLVYPYKTYLQMVRHSIEGNRVSAGAAKVFREIVEQMRQQGIPDLAPDDLTPLWKTRTALTAEQQAIERTLQEIRTRRNGTPKP
jgi:hypothetical protein